MEDNNKLLHTELCGFKDIVDERLKSVSEVLHRIEQQTTAINGRVRRLEVWRGATAGAISIITLIVVPILLMAVSRFFE